MTTMDENLNWMTLTYQLSFVSLHLNLFCASTFTSTFCNNLIKPLEKNNTSLLCILCTLMPQITTLLTLMLVHMFHTQNVVLKPRVLKHLHVRLLWPALAWLKIIWNLLSWNYCRPFKSTTKYLVSILCQRACCLQDIEGQNLLTQSIQDARCCMYFSQYRQLHGTERWLERTGS